MNTWKAILAAVVIFGAGLVTGAVWMKVSATEPAQPTPETRPSARPHPQLSMEHLRKVELMMCVQKELDLTPEQRARIEKVISDAQERVRDLWEQVSPEIYAELQDVKSKLCSELTPEQSKRFNELLEQQKHKKSSSNSSTNSAAKAAAP